MTPRTTVISLLPRITVTYCEIREESRNVQRGGPKDLWQASNHLRHPGVREIISN